MSNDVKNTFALQMFDEKYSRLTKYQRCSLAELKTLTALMDKKTAEELYETTSNTLKTSIAGVELSPHSIVWKDEVRRLEPLVQVLQERVASFFNTKGGNSQSEIECIVCMD